MLTFKQFCQRTGLGWPLPLPNTPEAEKWIDDQMGQDIKLDENEIRMLLAQNAFNIHSWAFKTDVATKELLLKTISRMKELAERMP